ncbi:MAG TPA: hypothetical protein IAD19_04930 [Candidatus Egerieicola faecale]|jgi:hypothetical protein|uniref:Uncharacterized protein n=1 Tax=Candidatus Egerieicola faecale TaxID=2840774 RepID=A0A9D1IRQ0_9FIRM|nr:hypothetical protein [Candidatus Egerieicola faecale]
MNVDTWAKLQLLFSLLPAACQGKIPGSDPPVQKTSLSFYSYITLFVPKKQEIFCSLAFFTTFLLLFGLSLVFQKTYNTFEIFGRITWSSPEQRKAGIPE